MGDDRDGGNSDRPLSEMVGSSTMDLGIAPTQSPIDAFLPSHYKHQLGRVRHRYGLIDGELVPVRWKNL